MNFTILYEDQHIIVCVKPNGIATQSSCTYKPDMESLLKNHLCKSSSLNSPPYLGIIHRLDQPVEGILVFAKTTFAAKELNLQLREYGFKKHYQAFLSSPPADPEGTLVDYLVRDSRTNTSKVCSSNTIGAKRATLHYKIIESRFPGKILVDINLETGRHHQIRVQMSHMGCPIVGDKKYNHKTHSTVAQTRLALCANSLSFLHPKTKKEMTFNYQSDYVC